MHSTERALIFIHSRPTPGARTVRASHESFACECGYRSRSNRRISEKEPIFKYSKTHSAKLIRGDFYYRQLVMRIFTFQFKTRTSTCACIFWVFQRASAGDQHHCIYLVTLAHVRRRSFAQMCGSEALHKSKSKYRFRIQLLSIGVAISTC